MITKYSNIEELINVIEYILHNKELPKQYDCKAVRLIYAVEYFKQYYKLRKKKTNIKETDNYLNRFLINAIQGIFKIDRATIIKDLKKDNIIWDI